jgi:hypothetical protein
MKAIALLFALVVIGSFSAHAQKDVAFENLPDAPTPAADGMALAQASLPSAKNPHGFRRWVTTENVSYVVLFSGAFVDYWGTYDNMTNSHWLCGYNPKNGPVSFSVDGYPPVGNGFPQLVAFCGPGPGGQSANYLVDVASEEKLFTEGAWVVQWHMVDDRNVWGTIGINAAVDVAQLIIHFHGRKKQTMEVLNFTHGISHAWAGLGNFNTVRKFGNPNHALEKKPAIDQAYPEANGRWWAQQKVK